MNFLKIKEKLIKRKTIYYIFLFISIFLISGEFAFAAEDTIDVWGTIIEFINGLVAIIAAILGLVTTLVSWLLSPEWYNGKVFGLDIYFKHIWIFVSNIVYVIFAIILIVIAFMNIIGKGDKWELKQALPRFAVGVLIVPLSWFFTQFVLSIVGVLTISVLSLPYEVFDDNVFDKIDSSAQIDSLYVLNLGEPNILAANTCDGQTRTYSGPIAEDQLLESCIPVTIEEIMRGNESNGNQGLENSIFGIITIYTYGIMKVPEVSQLTQSDVTSGGITAIKDLLTFSVFNTLMVLVYGVLMIALFMALFIRGVMLWIYTMFSPVFGLLYFFGKSSEGVGEGQTKFSIKEFISLAMVPVYVSGALGFGLAFLFIAANGINSSDRFEGDGLNQECLISSGVFKFCINGTHGGQNDDDFLGIKGVLARLLLEIFGIVILWVGVMAALKSSKATAEIIKPIEDFGKQVGGLVMKSPTYAPIIPTGKGKRMSISGIGQMTRDIRSSIESKSRNTGTQFLKDYGLFQNGTESGDSNKIINAQTAIERGRDPQSAKALKDAILSFKNIDDMTRNNQFRELLKEWGKKFGMEEEINKYNLSNSSDMAKVLGLLDRKFEKESGLLGTKGLFEGEKYGNAKPNDINTYLSKVHGDKSSDGKSTTKIETDKPLEVKLVGVKNNGVQTNRLLGLNIEVNEKEKRFADDGDYQRIARELNNRGLVGEITETDFRKTLESMNIDNPKEQGDIIGKIKEYFKKDGDKVVYSKDGGNGADPFKQQESQSEEPQE